MSSQEDSSADEMERDEADDADVPLTKEEMTTNGLTDRQRLEEIKSELAKIRQSFMPVLDLIPAQFYMPSSETETAARYSQGKRKAPKSPAVEAEKKAAKRAKLNPNAYKSIPQLQLEAAEAEERRQAAEAAKEATLAAQQRKRANKAKRRQAEGSKADMDDDSEGADGTQVPLVMPVLHPRGKAANAAELHDRLKKRIEEIRAKRNQSNQAKSSTSANEATTTDAETDAPGSSTREALLEARRLKREAQKANKASKLKLNRKKSQKSDKTDSIEQTSGLDTDMTPMKPSAQFQEAISYGRFKTKSDGRYDLPVSSSDPKAKLSSLQLKQEKRSKALAEANGVERAAIEQQEAFDKALSQASGQKVYDDPALLKANIKRKEQAKKASAKFWQDKNKSIALEHRERDAKKEANIAARKSQQKKGKHKEKKGSGPDKFGKADREKKGQRPRPGFEGTIRSGGKRKV